jgi:hypothetical protein
MEPTVAAAVAFKHSIFLHFREGVTVRNIRPHYLDSVISAPGAIGEASFIKLFMRATLVKL